MMDFDKQPDFGAQVARKLEEEEMKDEMGDMLARSARDDDLPPSRMLETPGCWACDEMGAALAGVFCGVLEPEYS